MRNQGRERVNRLGNEQAKIIQNTSVNCERSNSRFCLGNDFLC